jgi:drug/metabolite transporter (DMT)-like permease
MNIDRAPSHKALPEGCEEKDYIIDLSAMADKTSDASDEVPRSPNTPKYISRISRSLGPVWVVLWFTLNVGLALLMKFVFTSSSFKFPVLMSAVHMLVGTFLSQFVMKAGLVENQKVSEEGERRLRYFVILFCLNIAFGNIAVKIVNLPLSQIVRSTIPVFMMVAARFILKTSNNTKVVLSVVPIVVGVAMTAYGDVELTFVALALLCIGNVFAALKVVVTNMYLVQDKLHPMVMLAKLSPLATVVMFAFAVMNGEVATFSQVYNQIDASTYVWVFISGVISFALNWTNFLANMNTSPLTMSVLGNLKQVVLVFLSISLFNTHIALLSGVGIAIATIGMSIYSYLKYQEVTISKYC